MKASQQEKTAATASTNLSNQLSSQYSTAFANSQNIQGGLNAQLQNVTNQGLAGQGFMPGEEANLRSDADERSAQANAQAETALNARNAGVSAGGAATSGAVGSNNALLASNSAENLANAQRGITNQNALLAQNKVSQGLSGLSGLSGQITSQADSLGGTAVGASQNSFNNETQAFQPSNFWGQLGTSVLGAGLNAIAPGVGTLASGVLGGLTQGSGQQGLRNINAMNSYATGGLQTASDDDIGDAAESLG
jgi:hypothetical protein